LPPEVAPLWRRAGLRGLALRENGLQECELAERIVRFPPGKALSRETVGPAERVAHPDIAELVDRAAGHPPIVPVREIRPLLVQGDRPVFADAELVPPDAPAPARGIDRVGRENGFAVSNAAIDHPGHEFVALRVEPLLGARLRYAFGELPVTEIVVGRDGNRDRPRHLGPRRIIPV